MPRDVRAPIVASLACALAVPVSAFFAYEVGPAVHLDVSILSHLSQPEGSRDYGLAKAVASLANPLPFLVILVGLTALGLAARRLPETVAALVVVAGANLSTQVFKHLLAHERFDAVLGAAQPSAEAFPSGHTTAAASLAVALFLIAPARRRPLAAGVGAAFTAAVGLGVVAIDAHYPSDVLGALFVVGAWGFAAIVALRLWSRYGPEARRHGKEQTASGRFAVTLR